MYKIRLRLGLNSMPHLCELTALPLTNWLHLRDPYLLIYLPSSKEGKERESKRRKKGGSKKGIAPQSSPPVGSVGNVTYCRVMQTSIIEQWERSDGMRGRESWFGCRQLGDGVES